MKDFLKENFILITIAIIIISIIVFSYKAIDREYEFYEKTLEYGIEHNVDVEIEK